MKSLKCVVLLILSLVLGFASCSDSDIEDNTPLVERMKGFWWTMTDREGTFGEARVAYSRVAHCICFEDDGTGYCVSLYFDNNSSDPVMVEGGKGVAGFKYASAGANTARLSFEKAASDYAEIFGQWKVSYANGHVVLTDGSETYDMEHPSAAMVAKIEEWSMWSNGGAGFDDYNVNDKDFTQSTWRKQEAIYLYDGVGSDTVDAYGRSGYSLVPLPWYRGTKQTNIPNGFCDEIMPQNGWEWVFNSCGNRAVKSSNFFGVYNKYTGILRIFYYMPEGFRSGNDHVWQVSMTDNLAQRSMWAYGNPTGRIITQKANMNQPSDGTFVNYVAPWVDYMSKDGLIVPNAGWWVFDVDLSSYHPITYLAQDIIKLQMRSWDVSHVSLYSTLTAKLDGTVKATMKLEETAQKSSSTAQGVLMGLTAAANAGSAIANFLTGNWGMGFSSVAQLLGTGTQMAGFFGENVGQTKYGIDGTISLGCQGTIDTDGFISKSTPVVGVASPTLSVKDFDLKNTHIGQGVWNLKHPPVVYYDKVYESLNYDQSMAHRTNADFPYCGSFVVNFFDPNSIELDLNPNVFKEEDIEWMEVEAMCFGRAQEQFGIHSNQQKSQAEKYAEAYGVPYPNIGYSSERFKIDANNPLTDFLHYETDKLGFDQWNYLFYQTPEGDLWANRIDRVAGRGKNGVALEPLRLVQYFSSWHSAPLPAHAINVKVRIKLKGFDNALVLSRNYLPEYRRYDPDTFRENMEKARPYASKIKKSELYDLQMKRIDGICEVFQIPYKVDTSKPYTITDATRRFSSEGAPENLFDNNTSTHWTCQIGNDWKWFIDFYSRKPINPSRYFMTTNDEEAWGSAINSMPKSWKLYGKLKKSDEWTLLDSQSDGSLPHARKATKWFDFAQKGNLQYFRIEFSAVNQGTWISFSELGFDVNP